MHKSLKRYKFDGDRILVNFGNCAVSLNFNYQPCFVDLALIHITHDYMLVYAHISSCSCIHTKHKWQVNISWMLEQD